MILNSHNTYGGYFELELQTKPLYHSNAIALNSGRNCLEYLIISRGIQTLYLPYYTCEVLLEPCKKHNVNVKFYNIDEHLEIKTMPNLSANEYFLYTNYFGIKDKYIGTLENNHLIIDNSQSFYSLPIIGADTFYSPRKFFGVPDGGYLYTDCPIKETLEVAKSTKRFSHLLSRIEEGVEASYALFKENDASLSQLPMQSMSILTAKLLESIDYENICKQRNLNFQYLHSKLSHLNLLDCINNHNPQVAPMIYPLRVKNIELRKKLIEKKIFVATYWPNVKDWTSPEVLEYQLTNEIIPLPIDQRYNANDMQFIANTILEYA